jgi:hypothetical protein
VKDFDVLLGGNTGFAGHTFLDHGLHNKYLINSQDKYVGDGQTNDNIGFTLKRFQTEYPICL